MTLQTDTNKPFRNWLWKQWYDHRVEFESWFNRSVDYTLQDYFNRNRWWLRTQYRKTIPYRIISIATDGGYAPNTENNRKESNMGLDMYAYVATRAGQQREFWDTAEAEPGTHEFVSRTVQRPREIAYWRKHPNLHGWFKQEWESAGNSGSFNGDELEITWDMLERLEYDVINGELPQTSGFFFGNNSDAEYYEDDLEFIRQARAELFMGLKVFYNSSW